MSQSMVSYANAPRLMAAAVALVAALLVAPLTGATSAQAAEVKLVVANGMQPVLEELRPRFERASGHTLKLLFVTGGSVPKRATEEDAVDGVVATQAGIDALAKDGRLAPGAVAALARAGISVAVRQGAARPDITSPESFKQALLAARAVTYLDPKDGGASGIHFAKVLERLGIAEAMRPKTRLAPNTGAVGALVATGEAELGVLQYQLLFAVPGIEVVGPLPGDLQSSTVFSAALMSGAAAGDASRALLAFLRSPEAAAVIKAKGLEPAAQ